MPNISERLNTLAASLTPEQRRTLSTDLVEFARRLGRSTVIDWQNGKATYDEATVWAAAANLQHSTSYAIGSTFADDVTANLREGFAVLDRDHQDVVPWRALTDRWLVDRLSEGRLQALGVSLSDPDSVRAEFAARFTTAPKSLATTTAATLIDGLRDRQLVTAATVSRRSSNGAATARAGATDGGAALAFPADFAQDIQRFVREDLPAASPTTISWTVGPGICLTQQGARRLVSILRAGGLAGLAEAATAAAAAGGVAAALVAAVAAVGGWWVLIVLISVVVFSGWLESVITPNGACIHFPWWAGFGPIPFGR